MTGMQLDLFAEPKPTPTPWVEPVKRAVTTRAYGREHVLMVAETAPDPVEIEVRGIPCLIDYNFGFNTYTIQPPGSLFWSGTGFRSWTNGTWFSGEGIRFEGTLDDIRALIEAYIAAPTKKEGLGGQLVRWWPAYVREWRDRIHWELTQDRTETWAQWGPDRHAECWAHHDRTRDDNFARMIAEGIDPNDIGAPPHFRGKWPKFDAIFRAA